MLLLFSVWRASFVIPVDSERLKCFGRHVKPLVPVAFAVVSTYSSFKKGGRQAGGRLLNPYYPYMIKNMLYRPHLVWEKDRKKKKRSK
jgi:hypothetical protein